jgi:hypothetical protein
MAIDERKVEFLKVWYALFCTIMDAHSDREYSDVEAISKLRDLRNALTTRLPEVEADLLNRRLDANTQSK